MFKGLKKRIADGMEGVSPGRQSPLQPRLEKRHGARKKVKPSLVCTDHSSNHDAKDNNNSQVNGHAGKSSSPREVLARVHHLLEVGKAQAQNNGLLEHSASGNQSDVSNADMSDLSQTLNSSANEITQNTPQAASTPAILPVTPQRTQRRLSNASNVSATGDERSDVESDFDHTPKSEAMTKDDVFQLYKKQERTLQRYKSKFSELVDAYKGVQKDKEKLEGALTAGQDKQLRRISELKETIELEQTAKRHLEETLRMSLDEKDEVINVLQTQVHLLKTKTDGSEVDGSLDSSASGNMSLNGTLTEKVSDMEGVIKKQKDEIFKLKTQSKDAREVILQLEQEKKMALQDMMSNAGVIADAKDDLAKQVILLKQQLQEKSVEIQVMIREHEDSKAMLEEDIRNQVIAEGHLKKDREAEILFKQKEEELKQVLANKVGDFQRVLEDKERQKNDAVKYKDDVIKKLEEKITKLEKVCEEYVEQKQDMESSLDKLVADKEDLLGVVQAKEESITKQQKEDIAKVEADLKACQQESQQQLTKIKKASQKKILELQEVIKSNENFLKELQEKHTKDLEEKTKEYENMKQNDVTKMKKIVKDLRGKIQEKDSAIENLKSEMETLSAQISSESSTKTNMEYVVDDMKQNLQSKDNEIESLKQHLAKMEKDYTSSVQELLGKHNTLVESHRVELDSLQNTCTDNEKLLEESKESFASVVESLSIATSKVTELEKQLQNKQDAVEERDMINRTLTDDLETVNKQIEQLKQQHENQLNHNKESNEKALSRLQDDIASMKRMQTAEEELKATVVSQNDAKLNDLQRELLQTQEKMKRVQESNAEVMTLNTSLEKEKQELANKMEDNTFNFKLKLDSIEKELQSERHDKIQLAKTTELKLKQLQEKYDILQIERDEINNNLVKSSGEYMALDYELKQLKESYQGMEEALQQQLKTKEEENASLDATIVELKSRAEEQENLYTDKIRSIEEQRREQITMMEKEFDSRLSEKENDLRQKMNDFIKEKDLSLENVNEQYENMRKQELTEMEERYEKRTATMQDEFEARLKRIQEEENNKIEHLTKEHEEYVAELKQQITNESNEKSDLMLTLKEKGSETQNEIGNLLQEKNHLENLCKEFEIKLSSTVEGNQSKLAELKESHQKELMSLRQKTEDEIGGLCSKHEQDLSHWKKVKDELQVSKDLEIENLTREHAQLLEVMKKDLTASQSEVKSLQHEAEIREAEQKVVLSKELESVVADSRTKIEAIENDAKTQEQKHAQAMQDEIKKWEDKVKQLQTKYKKIVEDRSSKSNASIERMQEEHAVKILSIKEQHKAKIEKHENEISSLEQRLKDTISNLADVERLKQDMKVQHEKELKEVNTKLECSVKEKEQLCKLHEDEKVCLQSEMNARKKREEELQQQRDAHESGSKEISDRLTALHTEKEELLVCVANLQKQVDDNRNQHQTETDTLKEAALKSEESLKQQLETTSSALKRMAEEHDEKLQEMSEQAKSKLMDMKKKAEGKITNIKKQHASVLESKDAEIAELNNSLSNLSATSTSLTESTKEELDRIMKQHQAALESAKLESNSKIEKQEELLCEKEILISKLSTEVAEFKEKIEEMLIEKVDSLKMLQQNLKDDHAAELAKLQAEHEQKLEVVEKRSSARVEEKEFEYSSRVKQIVKEFQQKLNDKEREIQEATEHAMDNSQKEERKIIEDYNQQIIEFKREMRMRENDMVALRKETDEQVTAIQTTLDQREEEHRLKFEEIEKDYHNRLDEMTKTHEAEIESLTQQHKQNVQDAEERRQNEMSVIENTYAAQIEGLKEEHHNDKSAIEKKLKTQMKKNQLEMKKLLGEKGKGLHPGKLMDDSNDRLSPVPSNPNSDSESDQPDIASLKMQLASMAKELSVLKERENQLQQSLQQSTRPATLDLSTPEHSASFSGLPSNLQSPEPTQFEYMKKILFEFMMGRQKSQMAKVLTAIAQFSPTQTRQVLEKIQQSETVVGMFS